ncbi:MAG TPA: hypothetical protein VHE35_27125 [Kofleriaceae bacterium]|nr:hypothetical protein [Kofleriaceae bacterium]
MGFAGACSSEPVVDTDRSALISDQAHDQGTHGFFFLAPTVAVSPHNGGPFAARVSPVVSIDRINPASGATLQHIVTFDGDHRVHGSRVRRNLWRGFYVVRWRTADYDLSTSATYRIRVSVAGHQLGFADLDVVRTNNEYRHVDTDDYIPLKVDGTLPIKFRIETSAVDRDGDGVMDWQDNCPDTPNGPGLGLPNGWPHDPPWGCDPDDDECDPDEDDCGGPPAQQDTDHDGIGDACECDHVTCAPADACHSAGACQSTTGTCTGGTSLPDGDGDGTCNAIDGCPADPAKIAPGACGCGVADTDSDHDGTPDCHDTCPLDPTRTEPGVCGCAGAETDGDHDGTPDCLDACPADPGKTQPGVCGCGVADTDGDHDGTADCHDACPADPLKLQPGVCGCGVADSDSDHDGTLDCQDACPADPGKLAPGACGCGIADTDADHDGSADCQDACPADPLKSQPGVCGCGHADADGDHDGAFDCQDACPQDGGKVQPGVCGCGHADVDGDGDGALDCQDACPADPAKTHPGLCGCGAADDDTDGDGAPDCRDACPADPAKTQLGVCGCGVADTDADHDGIADCHDACPADPHKLAPGACGCGVADTGDSDGDGQLDCVDACPQDPGKTQPGVCGCGTADDDGDLDGIADCTDPCPGDHDNTCPQECRVSPFNVGDVPVGAPLSVRVDILNYDVVLVSPDGSLLLQAPGEPAFDARLDAFAFGQGALAPAIFLHDTDHSVRVLLTPLAAASYRPSIEISGGTLGTACIGSPLRFTAQCPGVADDFDQDGVDDCADGCPSDPDKADPGDCGCFTPDSDDDGDGVADCLE